MLILYMFRWGFSLPCLLWEGEMGEEGGNGVAKSGRACVNTLGFFLILYGILG